MKNNNYHTASLILILVTVFFLVTYPFRDYFTGGLLSSLFGAAMIGGIADWFGITALFRKPLGIPFRTRIIPRSRDKIFSSLVTMVEDELLTVEIIENKLAELDFSNALVRYMELDGGQKDLACLLEEVLGDFIKGLDRAETEKLLSFIVNSPDLRLELADLVINAAKWSIENGYETEMLEAIIPALSKITKSKQLGSTMEELSSRLFERMAGASAEERGGRGLALKIIFALPGINQAVPLKMAQGVISEIDRKLMLLGMPRSRSRRVFIKKAVKYLELIRKDDNTRSRLNGILAKLVRNLEWEELLKQSMQSLDKESGLFESNSGLSKTLENMLGMFMEKFKQNDKLRESFNTAVRNLLFGFIREKHAELGRLVREQLDTYSDDDIVELVESKAGNDLQIIRINGSVVGGLIGALSFLITYFI